LTFPDDVAAVRAIAAAMARLSLNFRPVCGQ
jgi:hypothetical protein